MNGFEEQLRPALRESGLPGIVCAAAGPNALLDLASLGHIAFDASERMSLDTTFWIASITKLATAVAVLQLVERKRLRFEHEAADYLPFFRDLEVLTEVGLVPATTRVTVQHLMTHTAGFGYETWSRPLAEHVLLQNLPAARSGLRRSLERPLLFQPGDMWNYGIGMDWAGLLVERIAGCSLGEYLRAHVFEPLQMHSTGFAPRADAIRAALYARQAGGSLASAPNAPNPDRDFDAGGAGLYATPRDVLRLLQSILRAAQGSTQEVLQPQTVAEARRNQIGLLEVRDLPTCAPERSSDLVMSPDTKKWSHFGLLHLEAQPGGRSANSISWAGIANTFFWIDFEAGLAAVAFAQSLPFLDPSVLALVGRYERCLYAGLRAG